jgi:aspartate kinase
LSLTVDSTARLAEICDPLAPFAEVTVEPDQAILCAVGDGLGAACGIAARFFGALRDVNVRMISQGASHRNLSVVVADANLQEAAACVHREFFMQLDPAVFD